MVWHGLALSVKQANKCEWFTVATSNVRALTRLTVLLYLGENTEDSGVQRDGANKAQNS